MTVFFTVLLAWIIAQSPPPAGALGGRITDKQTGAPIARAVVQLYGAQANEQYKAQSDENGRYLIANLPPGEYRGMVNGGAFRATYLFETLRDASGRPTIALKEGETRTDVNVALPRAGSLSVRVADERGDPLSNVEISLTSTTTGMVSPGWLRKTDDLGRVRAFGLTPGHYTVCAGASALNFSTEARAARRDQLLRTCYPDTIDESKAEPLAIGPPDLDIEIRLRRGRSTIVSGIVLDASGAPVSAQFALNLSSYIANGSSARMIPLGPDGRFRIANLMPGDYALEGSVGGRLRAGHRRDHEAAYVPLHVDSSDIADLVIRLFRTADVSGRFVFEDLTGPPPQAPGSGLMVFARLADDPIVGQGSMRTTNADKAGHFTLEGMFGRRVIDVANVPTGWFVKSIRHGDAEMTTAASEFTSRTDPLEVVLSRRGATLAGRVLDDAGRPVRGARVIVFGADQTMWAVHYPSTIIASAEGSFRVGPLRGGDYFVAALAAGTSAPDWRDRNRFAALAAVAERISLDNEEPRTLDLRLSESK